MKTFLPLLLLATAVFAGGCANTTAVNAARIANQQAATNGSPFRWEVKTFEGGATMQRVMMALPSVPTQADAVLQQDIMALLQKAELSQNRTSPQVEDIKRLPDGREVWILKFPVPGEGIAYILALHPSPQGGTDINLQGPTPFRKPSSDHPRKSPG